jgi:glycosyltransferase involved in cell wall biosynthesis
MNFSVIIPAYQAAAMLPCCLGALQRQTIDRAQYEIIVVDDGSTDSTAEVAEQTLRNFPAAQVIRAKHSGPASARNRGAWEAQGDLLLFTDADCEPVPEWIEQFARAFADPSISAPRAPRRAAAVIISTCNKNMKALRSAKTIDILLGRLSTRRLCGKSPARCRPVPASVDQEFSFVWRRAAIGWPSCERVYHGTTTFSRYFRRKYNIGYWKMYLLKRYPGKAVRDSHTPQLVKVQIALLAAALAGTLGVFLPPTGPLIAIGLWIAFGLSMLPLLIGSRDPRCCSSHKS